MAGKTGTLNDRKGLADKLFDVRDGGDNLSLRKVWVYDRLTRNRI